MGEVASTKPVLGLFAIFARQEAALDWATDWIERSYGAVALRSPRFAFEETDYYRQTMGDDLLKQFVVLESLIDPGRLPQLKLDSNTAEASYRELTNDTCPRPLNIDPGYLTLSKLVLASTKNHAHRIYLRDGIFAEITLRYQARAWQPWDWTYPDYRREDFGQFFDRCREYLKTTLMSDG